MLCDVCRDMLHHRRNEIDNDGSYSKLGHHYGSVTLKQSAMEKCYICLPLWQKLLDVDQDRLHAFETRPGRSAVKIWKDEKPENIHNNWITVCALITTRYSRRMQIYLPWILFNKVQLEPSFFSLQPLANIPKIAIESSTMSISSLHCARRWLDECISSHEMCAKDIDEIPWSPTRLLYVEHHRNIIERVRLIHTAREQPREPYLTLSHRWGENETLKLTRYNIGTFGQAIDLSSLPKTFSDAIRVTVALGYQYLWIDSLCIIQDEDDLSDWSYEAGLMHKVYLHSRCNISASVATSSDEGLSRNRDPKSVCAQIVSVQVQSSRPWTVHKDFLLERLRIWEENIPQCHLNTRGWVFQERILSPRVVHFCNDQLFWECQSHRACETQPSGHDDLYFDSLSTGNDRHISKFKGLLGGHDLQKGPDIIKVNQGHSLWMEVMTIYSNTSLSYPADRLVALSGIAKQTSVLVQDTYVAGMWRKTLPYDLLWFRSLRHGSSDGMPIISAHRSDVYIAPSWSWASINCPIHIWFVDWDTFLFDILDLRLQYATEDVTGRVIGGWMTLRVQLNPLLLWYDPAKKGWKATLSNVESAISIFRALPDEPANDSTHFDDDNVNGRLYYIPAAYLNHRGKESIIVLLLRTVDGEAGVFTRFGLAYQEGRESDGLNQVRRILTELNENEKQKLPSLDYQDGKHIIRVI